MLRALNHLFCRKAQSKLIGKTYQPPFNSNPDDTYNGFIIKESTTFVFQCQNCGHTWKVKTEGKEQN